MMQDNRRLHHSTGFRVRFTAPGKIPLVNACTGLQEPWQGENDCGQGMLLCLTP